LKPLPFPSVQAALAEYRRRVDRSHPDPRSAALRDSLEGRFYGSPTSEHAQPALARARRQTAARWAALSGKPAADFGDSSGFFVARVNPKRAKAKARQQLTPAQLQAQMRADMSRIRSRTPAGRAAWAIAELGRRVSAAETREVIRAGREFFASLGLKTPKTPRGR
jgi:hypothetical protein